MYLTRLQIRGDCRSIWFYPLSRVRMNQKFLVNVCKMKCFLSVSSIFLLSCMTVPRAVRICLILSSVQISMTFASHFFRFGWQVIESHSILHQHHHHHSRTAPSIAFIPSSRALTDIAIRHAPLTHNSTRSKIINTHCIQSQFVIQLLSNWVTCSFLFRQSIANCSPDPHFITSSKASTNAETTAIRSCV